MSGSMEEKLGSSAEADEEAHAPMMTAELRRAGGGYEKWKSGAVTREGSNTAIMVA